MEPQLSTTSEVPPGGAFLFREVGSEPVMCPERFTEEQRQYHQTAAQFARGDVLPLAPRIEKKEPGLLQALLKKAGELGLLMIDIPEKYGGLGLDKTTSLLVAEAKSIYGAWSVTFGAHTGIGTLPITWFGTPAQKEKYLPKLATGEWIAAYALTETGSGSDALGAKTTAVKSVDGKHYLLNGSKQFITNAAFADVFVVFAKVDGDKFTGFIVDRATPGLTVGPEEHKMGIRGSSTCGLIFEDAKVPVENVLGEIGRGHKIAFNILNVGRLKLGVGVVGGMKIQLESALKYALERRQFQTALIEFPLIREKFARMVAGIYAVESMAYRTSGLIDARLHAQGPSASQDDAKTIAAIEEYAPEASILKVTGSETLTMVVDEAVQIHGGYGYIEEFPVERAYRDQRINRIFEGTNEINRMLTVGMLLKRALKGQLPLFDHAAVLEAELANGQVPKAKGTAPLDAEAWAAEMMKRLAVYSIKTAAEAYGPELDKHQEILAAISDIVADAYAVDTMVTRTRQCAKAGQLDPVRVAAIRWFTTEAHARAYERAKKALCGSAQGDALAKKLKAIEPLYAFVPYDSAQLRELMVKALEAAGSFPIGLAR